MPVTIQNGTLVALIRDNTVQCKDPVAKSALLLLCDPDGVSPSDPDPDFTIAQKAEALGFSVKVHVPPKHKSGAVY